MANGVFVGAQRRFYWNVDAKVGPGCPNHPDDVQLVQLGFACRAINTKNPPSPESKAVYAAVVPGAVYTGTAADPLSVAIRLAQKERGGTQDGYVSVIGTTGVYAPDISWMLIGLDNNIADVLGANWPFLDRHALCPAALKAVVNRVLVVPS